uniref:DUF4939 domain-containing protein n=1 Tax=Panagrellus redivivus TaxID=6233 RepID=A0A7E4W005_PANRE
MDTFTNTTGQFLTLVSLHMPVPPGNSDMQYKFDSTEKKMRADYDLIFRDACLQQPPRGYSDGMWRRIKLSD